MRFRRHRLTLVEVAIGALIFALSLGSILAVLGTARGRILRAQRRWARAHLLTQAVEFHMLAGDRETVPEGLLPEGFSAQCEVMEPEQLPEMVEPVLQGWKLVSYRVSVIDPAGERVAETTIETVLPEQW